MASKKNPMVQNIAQSVIVAVILALLGGAWKLYTDVQMLKAKFEYTNGRWELPAEAK